MSEWLMAHRASQNIIKNVPSEFIDYGLMTMTRTAVGGAGMAMAA
jgi:hypothetical protein